MAAMTLEVARRFEDVGFSIIPIRLDGSKAPAIDAWKEYQIRRAQEAEFRLWFARLQPFGIALIHGAISGNSEAVDVDCGDIFDDFHAQALEAVPALVNAPLIATPRLDGGRQIIYRNVDPPSGNLILARRPDPEKPGKFKTAIETRGEGGYTVTIGSPSQCHPANRPYRLIGGSFRTIPTLTADQRAALHTVALGFDQAPAIGHVRASALAASPAAVTGDRPGDDFNRRASWEQILEPHGWRCMRGLGSVGYWSRPGKSCGTSATTNYADTGLLYVFSSNAEPFEGCRAYTKFGAFTLLEHHGDFAEAARECARWRSR